MKNSSVLGVLRGLLLLELVCHVTRLADLVVHHGHEHDELLIGRVRVHQEQREH